MNVGTVVELLKDTYNEWSEDKAPRLGAALAYYTVFSLAPLLVIAIAIAGLFFGREAAQGQIVNQLAGLIGPQAGEAIQSMIQNASQRGGGVLATVLGFATLLFGASGVFGELQDALNTIWGVQPRPDRGWVGMIKDRFFSFTMVVGVGFLLLVSLVLTTLLSVLGTWFQNVLPGSEVVWQVINFVISFGVTTLLFAAIFKLIPDVEMAWSDVWVGAAVTSLLFSVGRFALGLYLGNSSTTSVYGAAGSLVIVLLWVYYSTQILFFGAEFTQVYANRYGSHIVPAANAVPMTDAAYAQQGAPRARSVGQAMAEQDKQEQPSAPSTSGWLGTVGGIIAGIFLASRGVKRTHKE